MSSAGSDGVASSGIPGKYIIISLSSRGCIAVLKIENHCIWSPSDWQLRGSVDVLNVSVIIMQSINQSINQCISVETEGIIIIIIIRFI